MQVASEFQASLFTRQQSQLFVEITGSISPRINMGQPDWAGLLKWSIGHSDGTTAAREISEEERAWCERVCAHVSVDLVFCEVFYSTGFDVHIFPYVFQLMVVSFV